MKHYGLIVADNGSDWYFQGEVEPALDERPDGRAEVDPGGRVRRGGRSRVPGGAELRRVRLRPELPRSLAADERQEVLDDPRALRA